MIEPAWLSVVLRGCELVEDRAGQDRRTARSRADRVDQKHNRDVLAGIMDQRGVEAVDRPAMTDKGDAITLSGHDAETVIWTRWPVFRRGARGAGKTPVRQTRWCQHQLEAVLRHDFSAEQGVGPDNEIAR